MAMDGDQSNFRRGVMSLVLLSLLKREDNAIAPVTS